MGSLATLLSKKSISVVREEKTVFPDGAETFAKICYLPTSLLKKNPKNNRFRKEQLSEKEHSDLLRSHPNFKILVKSIKEQPCFEATKVNYVNGEFILIDGHRRGEAALEAGREDFLAIVYEDLDEEQFEFLSEWNEENPTKLPHDAFYKTRGIALPIINAKTDEEREKILAKLKRRNLKLPQIDKAVNTHLYIKDFSKLTGESEEKRADQYKAFETVAQTRKEKFQTLRNIGEFEKIESLEKIAVDFLKANLAHDDIKVALDGLAERDLNNPLWSQISEKEIDTTKTSDLRRIVNEIRMNNTTTDLLSETRSFTQRIYGKLLVNPDVELIANLKVEVSSLLEKLTLLQTSGGGLQ